MGLAVGDSVGLSVGLAVGLGVGLSVEEAVGLSVGLEVEVATFCAKTALPPSDHKHLGVSEPASVAPLCEGPPLQSLLL